MASKKKLTRLEQARRDSEKRRKAASWQKHKERINLGRRFKNVVKNPKNIDRFLKGLKETSYASAVSRETEDSRNVIDLMNEFRENFLFETEWRNLHLMVSKIPQSSSAVRPGDLVCFRYPSTLAREEEELNMGPGHITWRIALVVKDDKGPATYKSRRGNLLLNAYKLSKSVHINQVVIHHLYKNRSACERDVVVKALDAVLGKDPRNSDPAWTRTYRFNRMRELNQIAINKEQLPDYYQRGNVSRVLGRFYNKIKDFFTK